jgi:hypothetical protein
MSNPEESRSHEPELSKGFSADDPPEIIRPTLPSDLRDFSTVDELIDRLTGGERSAFPYEQELTLYLLLVASLWPNDHERLLAAARIFSGSLNFHFSLWRQTKEWLLDPSGADSCKDEINWSREEEINSFNEKFFINIGGLTSLLFSPSVDDFHRDVRKRI